MKFIIATSFVPFIRGGATFIVDWLKAKFEEAGHQVDIVRLPFVEIKDSMFEQMLSYRLLNLSEHGDCLIALRPPAYLIQHPNKRLWFIHHFRVFYDLWQSEYCPFEDNQQNRCFRERLMEADRVGLLESKQIYTNSKIVQQRLLKFNQIQSTVLYPPVLNPEIYHREDDQPTIACVCRMEPHKRQHLLVEAMRHTRSDAKLLLAGTSSSDHYPHTLRQMVSEYGLSHRVEIQNRWISEEEKAYIFNHCRAVAYLPFDEDSYGYPSLEAQHASKPVLSTWDSGGVPELIIDRRNGRLVDANPKSIAAVIDEWIDDRPLAERMGLEGPKRIAELDITWNRVLNSFAA